jgi:CheY-like chemotaxis protein
MTLILVVDDESTILEMLQDLLTEAGYETAIAHDGRERLRRLSQQPPSLVLSDVMMPFLDGLDLARARDATPACREIPVVLMTAGGQSVIATDVPHAAYVAKPFDIDGLLGTLARVLASRRKGA